MGQTAAGQPPDTTGQAAADRAYQAASSHTSGNSPSAVGPAGAGDQERSGPEAASEAMRLSDLLFEVDKSLRYHQRRRAHFERWHRWSMLAIVLLGSAAVARWEDSISLLGVPANAMLGLLTALIGALDLVYAPAIRAGEHERLHRRFTELAVLIRRCDKPTSIDISRWETERLFIEADEPPIFWALEADCFNETARSLGRTKEPLNVVGWRRPLKHLIRFEGRSFAPRAS